MEMCIDTEHCIINFVNGTLRTASIPIGPENVRLQPRLLLALFEGAGTGCQTQQR